jgi:hypothetical protein
MSIVAWKTALPALCALTIALSFGYCLTCLASLAGAAAGGGFAAFFFFRGGEAGSLGFLAFSCVRGLMLLPHSAQLFSFLVELQRVSRCAQKWRLLQFTSS